MNAPKHIVVATDFSPASDAALDFAADLANSLGAKLSVVHAFETPYPYPVPWPPEYRQELLRNVEKRCAALRPVVSEVRAFVREGQPHQEILSLAAETGADWIVLGTHGRHGLPRLLLGSVADKVIRNSPIPVITVPGKACDLAGGVSETVGLP